MATLTAATSGATNARGGLYMIGSVFVFSLMDALVKWLGADYPVQQILFFRCLFALVPVMAFVHQAGGARVLRTRNPFGHLLRGVLGLTAMGCIFYAFTQMKLASAVALVFAAPLFLTALSVPLLGEQVGWRRWSAVLVGFVGVLIILQPGADLLDGAAPIALVGAAVMALTLILVRKLSAAEHVAAITFYFSVTGAVAGLALMLLFGWVAPTPTDALLLASVGLIGGVAQYLMHLAFRYAEAAVIAPLEYTAIIWTSLLGYLIWAEVPETRVYVGVAVIVASGLYIIYREAVRAGVGPPRLRRSRARP